MMQDNTPINFYIKHFFINCQIKKLQPIFDTFVPICIVVFNDIRAVNMTVCWHHLLFQFSNFVFPNLAIYFDARQIDKFKLLSVFLTNQKKYGF
jgi:hypothetical protein